MPIRYGSDQNGCYVAWGISGKKYYFPCGNTDAKDKATQKAIAQMKAIYASGYREKK